MNTKPTTTSTTVIHTDKPASIYIDGRADDTFPVPTWWFDSGTWARLTRAAQSVVMVLARSANHLGTSTLSVSQLSAGAGVSSRSNIINAVQELIAAGMVSRRRTKGGDRQQTNVYQLLGDRPDRRHGPPAYPSCWRDGSRQQEGSCGREGFGAVAILRAPAAEDFSSSGISEEETAAASSRGPETDLFTPPEVAAAAAELVKRGFKPDPARELVDRYGPDAVQVQCGNLDAEAKRKQVLNPTGFLIAALANDYAVRPGAVRPDEVQRQREAAERRRREGEAKRLDEAARSAAQTQAIDRVIAGLDEASIEEAKQRVLAGVTNAWLRGKLAKADPRKDPTLRVSIYELVAGGKVLANNSLAQEAHHEQR